MRVNYSILEIDVSKLDMTVEDSRPRSASKSRLNSSVGRFYEKRHQLDGALDQYSKALLSNPDDTSTYIDRSRVFLKMGSLNKAREDTDLALNLIGDRSQNSNLLFYNVCLQKAEVLYANGEFELALMYFYRANKIKPTEPISLEGIAKTTEILQCTICNPNIHLTITNHLIHNNEKQINLLNRLPIRKQVPSIELPLTEYTNKDANRLLIEIAKDRKLLIHLYTDQKSSDDFTGLNKAKIEARQAISIIESQLKFLDKAECFHNDEKSTRKDIICTSSMNRITLIRIAEEELMYLQKLPPKEKSIEILYRSMKIINCLQSISLDLHTNLMLAEAFRLIGQSYNEMKLFDQSIENYKQSYEILFPLKNDNCLYRSLFDLGRSLIFAGKYSEALERFNEMFNKSTSDNERAFVDQYISICYLNLNNFDQAKRSAYQSIDYAFQSNDELLSIEGNILLGRIYYKLKDFQHAEEYFLYAQKLKDQLGDLNQMKELDQLINEIKNSNQQRISSITRISNWRILTPYPHLFNICQKKY